jgi:hypothetical protein
MPTPDLSAIQAWSTEHRNAYLLSLSLPETIESLEEPTRTPPPSGEDSPTLYWSPISPASPLTFRLLHGDPLQGSRTPPVRAVHHDVRVNFDANRSQSVNIFRPGFLPRNFNSNNSSMYFRFPDCEPEMSSEKVGSDTQKRFSEETSENGDDSVEISSLQTRFDRLLREEAQKSDFERNNLARGHSKATSAFKHRKEAWEAKLIPILQNMHIKNEDFKALGTRYDPSRGSFERWLYDHVKERTDRTDKILHSFGFNQMVNQ